MIKINHLFKNYLGEKVLKDINIEIKKGEQIVILGPSGCGKSTFLRCLNLLEKPSEGNIFIEGVDITQKHVKIQKVRMKMGMVFQNFNLFPHFTILKNITFSPIILKIKDKQKVKDEAMSLLKKIGLDNKANMFPYQLSGGQKQRVAILRSLIMEPKIILLDEPTSALDPSMVGEVTSLIKEIAKKEITMITVTHEIDFAKEIAKKVLFMNDGKIIEVSLATDFFNKPKTKLAQRFLGLT